jgi:hypothetical protein
MAYKESFTFNQGDLGVNLATLDERVHNFIKTDLELVASRGEGAMKVHAPWTQTGMYNKWGRLSTGRARNGLWAEAVSHADRFQLYMGHEAPYGVYLEENYGGRFQVVMPTLIATAHVFMQSLTDMLNHLNDPAATAAVIEPGIGRQGTSQGVSGHAAHVAGATEKTAKTPRVTFRNAKGQFAAYKGVKLGEGATPKTPKTPKTKKTSTAAKKRKRANSMVFPVTVTYKKPGK